MNNIKNTYRYPGAQPFTSQQKQIFFGRDKDVEKLYDLLRLEKLVVLYSKSGLGKSSLINAGIIPNVESDDLLKPFLIRFGAYTEEQKKTPVSTTVQQIKPSNKEGSYLDKLLPEDNSFWHLIKKRQEKETNSKGILLVFDQFEELFTYSNKEIISFTKELKEIISNQIPQRFREALEKQFEKDDLKLNEKELELFHEEVEIKILLAIRSDRMSLLNELKDYLPNILRHCYELDALSVEQAEDAILNPAFKKDGNFICPNFDFEDESLDAILKFLTKNHTQKIESFQLQILCQNIEKKVIESEIYRIGISDIGNIESIYKNHYNNLISSIGNNEEQLAARKLIEEGLIFEEEERRLSLYEGQIFKSFGVSSNLLKRLVDNHLLRAEPSMQGGYTYELCHDTLVSPVLDAKKKRIEKEERLKHELEEKKLKELEEEKRQREEEKRLLAIEQKGKRRARILAIIGTLFGLVAISLAYFAINQKRLAEVQTDRASVALEKAKQAQLLAEKERKFAQEAEILATQAKWLADSLRSVSENKFSIISAQKSEIERQKKLIEHALIDAQKQKNIAIQEKSRADYQTEIAIASLDSLRIKQEQLLIALEQAEKATKAAKMAAEEYYKIASENIEKEYQNKVNEILKDSSLDDSEKKILLEDLLNQKEKALNQAQQLSEKLSKVELDNVSEGYKEAIFYYQQGDIQKAIEVLENSELINTSKPTENSNKSKGELSEMLMLKASLYRLNFQFKEANETYEEVLEIDSSHVENVLDIAEFFNVQNEIYRAINLYEGIINNPSISKNIKIEIYNKLGMLYYRNNNFQRAIFYIEKALEFSSDNKLELSNTLNNLGLVYATLNDYSKAQEAYIKALEIRRSLSESNPNIYSPDLAKTLNNLGNLYSDLANYTKAEDVFIETLEIYKKLAKENPQEYESELATTFNNLGTLYTYRNDLDKAINSFKEALKIHRRLANQNPDAYLPNVAMVLNNLGFVYKAMKNYENAKNVLIEALEIQRKLVLYNPDAFQPELAKVLRELGEVNIAIGEIEKAELFLLESFQIQKDLANKNPNAFDLEMGINFISLSQLYSGKIEENPDSIILIDKAQLYLKNAEAIFSNYSEVGSIDRYYSRLAEQYGTLSWYTLFTKNFSQAEEFAKQGLQLDESLIWINTNLAHALLFQGQYNKAEKIYLTMKDLPYQSFTFREVFLEDFNALEAKGVIPKEYLEDVLKIKKIIK